MFLSIYPNTQQIPTISYQSQLFLPQLYTAPLGDTLLNFANKNINSSLLACFPASEEELSFLQQHIFKSIQIVHQTSYNNAQHLPILYEKNACQSNKKLSFCSSFQYEASTGITQIYEIETLQQALAIEFIEYQKFVTYHILPPFKICPQCHICFISKRTDALYCSQNCVEKSFKKEKKKDPYYIKYRSLQQYYNKKINKWGKQLPSSAALYKKQYHLWQTLAKREYERLSTLTIEELPDISSFVKKLKAFWTIATAKTKK